MQWTNGETPSPSFTASNSEKFWTNDTSQRKKKVSMLAFRLKKNKKKHTVCRLSSLNSPLSSLTRQISHRAQIHSLVFSLKSWSSSLPLNMQIWRRSTLPSSPPIPIREMIFGSALENVLCQTHLSISHNSFFTQPCIDLLSQMRGHNKLFGVVPDTTDNGNYSQTQRSAPGGKSANML